jgi:hypothetical protein
MIIIHSLFQAIVVAKGTDEIRLTKQYIGFISPNGGIFKFTNISLVLFQDENITIFSNNFTIMSCAAMYVNLQICS